MRSRGNGTILILVSSLLVFVGLLGAFAQFVLFDARAFAERSLDALDEPALQREITEPLGLELTRLGVGAESLGTEPAEITRGLVANPTFKAAFKAAVAGAHRAVFDRDDDRPVVTIQDIDDPVRGQVEQISGATGGAVPEGLDLTLGSTGGGSRAIDAARAADSATGIVALLALAGNGLTGIAVWRAADRIAAGRIAGFGIALAGLGLLGAYLIGRAFVGLAIDGDQASAIAEAIYGAVAGDLLWLGGLTAAAGLLVAIGLSLLRNREPGGPAHEAETVQLRRPPAR